MVSTSPTKSGRRKLSEIARIARGPRGAVSTGWPPVLKTCNEKLGIEFDDWQHAVGQVILSKRADGKLAVMVDGVGMSLPRQVGKTYLLAALIFALCIDMPGLLVIWSAHHARTHAETFLAMQGFADRSKVKPYVRQVYTGSGTEEVRFHNGSRILFGARERGFGRGIPGVDVLIFDEAQILSDRALANMVATMNTSAFGLQLYIGTPPRPEDMSEVFRRMRESAIANDLPDGAWIEIGAPPGSDPNDRKVWPVMNPSHPKRTPVESILRLKRKLTPEDFFREGMGIWDDEDDPDLFVPFTTQGWTATAQDVHPAGPPTFFVTVAKGQRSAFIAVAADNAGTPHIGIADYRPGVVWLSGRVKELHENHPEAKFGAYSAGPVKAWAPTFAEFGVELELLTVPQTGAAFAHLQKVVDGVAVTHSPELVLLESLQGAVWREVEGGGFVLDWRKSSGDPAPIAAAAGALWLLESTPAAPFFAARR